MAVRGFAHLVERIDQRLEFLGELGEDLPEDPASSARQQLRKEV